MKILYFISFFAFFTLANCKLGIPLKHGYETKFIFSVEMYDDEHLLDCTGDLFIRRVEDKLIADIKNFEIHKAVNVNRNRIINSVSLPIMMSFDHKGKLRDAKDYEDWDWIDPRIVLKVIKYTDIPEKGNIVEESWEVSDLECAPQANAADLGYCVQMKLYYDLQTCIDPKEDEVVKDHHRIIKMDVDKEKDFITKIDYHYQLQTTDYEKQNNVNLLFVEVVKY